MKNVKPILLLLTAEPPLAQKVTAAFTALLGPVDFEGPWNRFDQTDYYSEEMGKNLSRCLISFENLFEPAQLGELKKRATQLERELSINGNRRINIDPGYLDLFKWVLATAKPGGQKIAVAADIYADPVLRYEKGGWHSFNWTFPDIKAGTYDKELTELRKRLKLQVKSASAHPIEA